MEKSMLDRPAAPGASPRTRIAGMVGVRVLVLASLVLATGIVPLGAQTTVTPAPVPRSAHPEAVAAIGELRSPYCPGLMLEVCPSPNAAALRDSIQALARDGMTKAQLVEWMIGNHGETYRAVPKSEGRGLVAWVGPPIGLALGLMGLLLLFMQIRRGQLAAVPTPPRRVLSDAERARVQAAMREMETLEEPIL
jgi:cytochrome c-type biogenesis protein CcmH/NrfF